VYRGTARERRIEIARLEETGFKLFGEFWDDIGRVEKLGGLRTRTVSAGAGTWNSSSRT